MSVEPEPPNKSNFNPRSLAGATLRGFITTAEHVISIHAPSQERPMTTFVGHSSTPHFNPRSLAGATLRFAFVFY